jgi:hypothetical protein
MNERARRRLSNVLDDANHFGHRESCGLVIDLFWEHGDVEDEFRVEVEDKRIGVRLLLYPSTGRDAIRAFHHAPGKAGDEMSNDSRSKRVRPRIR